MSDDSFELVVVGGGSAGLTAANFAARIGARVALIERSRLGGDCTWTGCIPSKALVHVAKHVHAARKAVGLGLSVDGLVDFTRVRSQVQRAVQAVYARETPELLAARGVTVLFGEPRLLAGKRVQLGERILHPARIVLATGAKPRLPSLEGLDGVAYFTHETIFDLEALPRRLLVLGAGPIGIELGQAFARLGSKVTLIGEQLLPRESAEARAALSSVLSAEGVTVLQARAERVEPGMTLHTSLGQVQGDALLIAVGRAPNVHGLGLEEAGVVHSAEGIVVDAHLCTSVPGIYAAGDAVGGPQFTHRAGFQGHVAARNALLAGSDDGEPRFLPRVTFCDPEIAAVGLSSAEAHTSGKAVVVVRKQLRESDRGNCDDVAEGFVELVASSSGKLLGATVVSSRAGEMLAPLIVALHRGMTLGELSSCLQGYPSYAMVAQDLAYEAALGAFAGSGWLKPARSWAKLFS